MLQSITTRTQTFNPFIFNQSNQKDNLSTLYKSVDEETNIDSINDNALLALVSFFEQSTILKSLSYSHIPAGNLYYQDRIVLKFSLAETHASYFPLLRGLFDFAKPEHALIYSDASEKTFVIEAAPAHATDAVTYVEKIVGWLTKEIKFKAALKQVIKLQEEAKRSQREAFDILRANAA